MHVRSIETASFCAAGPITLQRLFALGLRSIERGLKLVKHAKPQFVEVLPAPAYPLMASRHPEVRDFHSGRGTSQVSARGDHGPRRQRSGRLNQRPEIVEGGLTQNLRVDTIPQK